MIDDLAFVSFIEANVTFNESIFFGHGRAVR